MIGFASSQSRILARNVVPGLYVYVGNLWTPVVEAVTADALTTITVEARPEPLVFHPDDDVDVCTPATTK